MYKPIDFPKIERIDSPSGRRYKTPEGNLYPSVTSVFSAIDNPHIDAWRERIGKEEADRITSRAAKRGTYIHEQAEHLLKGTAAPVNSINNMLYRDLWKTFKPLVEQVGDTYCIETQLYSDALEVAGTVDCVGYWKGKLSIIDFKTSSRRKTSEDIDTYWMQTSAYAEMWYEHTNIPISNLVILMAVEDEDTLVFENDKSSWVDKFKEVRYNYKTKTGV